MSIVNKDIKTKGYVIRRTNYGEADRILNIITPLGKLSAMAKGVRKEKSRLAGAIEMFTLTDYVFHKGKGELLIVTSAKMLNHYNNILKDYNRMELAGTILKRVSKAADSTDNADFFRIVDQSLNGLNNGLDNRIVEAWVLLNLIKATGEQINIQRDIHGNKLSAGQRYEWDISENCFYVKEDGEYDENDIKVLRLLLSVDLSVVARVKNINEMIGKILQLIYMIAQL